jgi:hypothetical protein
MVLSRLPKVIFGLDTLRKTERAWEYWRMKRPESRSNRRSAAFTPLHLPLPPHGGLTRDRSVPEINSGHRYRQDSFDKSSILFILSRNYFWSSAANPAAISLRKVVTFSDAARRGGSWLIAAKAESKAALASGIRLALWRITALRASQTSRRGERAMIVSNRVNAPS